MRFVSEKPVDDDPDAGLVNPDEYAQPVDFQDEPVMRREVRAPSPRDFVNRRPPLPRWFRRPGPPDLSEGERQPPYASDELAAGKHITITSGKINHKLEVGTLGRGYTDSPAPANDPNAYQVWRVNDTYPAIHGIVTDEYGHVLGVFGD